MLSSKEILNNLGYFCPTKKGVDCNLNKKNKNIQIADLKKIYVLISFVALK